MELPPTAPLTRSVRRLMILGLGLTAWAFVIVCRLFVLQVYQHDKYQRLAQLQQEKVEEIPAERGTIFDRNGQKLAMSVRTDTVCVNPLRIPDLSTAAEILARSLSLDEADVLERMKAAQDSRRGFLKIKRQLSPEESERMRSLQKNLDWIELRSESARYYPSDSLASHVLGDVNAEGHGAAGVELKLDKELGGAPGYLRIVRDVKQRGYESSVSKEPQTGKNITLTIDSRLQSIAEDTIKDTVKKNSGKTGSIVVMDPKTGDVLAMANYPTYDPNTRMRQGEENKGRLNLAVSAPYEPGSVFKVITLAAALETTRLRPDTIINCGNGSMRLFGRLIHDHKSYPALSMAEVLARSSNIGAINIGLQVGDERLYDYVTRMGFGHRTGIQLPAESPGLVRPLKRWIKSSIGSVAMGHELMATTVQLGQACSIIANGGFLVQPNLVLAKQDPAGPRERMSHPAPRQVLRPETVMTMRQMMQGVVTLPHGTGRKVARIEGYTTAGKTGTAQIFDVVHHVYTHSYNASFMGFAPVTNPQVVVVVTVTGTTGIAGYGGTASGPAFAKVTGAALRLMDVPKDAPEKPLPEDEKSTDPVEDDLSIAELSDPLTPTEISNAQGSEDAAGERVVAVVDPDAPKAPSFLGKSLGTVIQEASEQGVEVELIGNGMARAQSPLPGSPLEPGERVKVRFVR